MRGLGVFECAQQYQRVPTGCLFRSVISFSALISHSLHHFANPQELSPEHRHLNSLLVNDSYLGFAYQPQ